MTTNFSEIADATRSFLDKEDKFTIPAMGEVLTTANADVQKTYADYEMEIARLESGAGAGAGATAEDIGFAIRTLKDIFYQGKGNGILVRADGPITVSYAQVGEEALCYCQLMVNEVGDVVYKDGSSDGDYVVGHLEDGPDDSWTYITATLNLEPGYYILKFVTDLTQVLNTSATVLSIYYNAYVPPIRPEFIERQPVQSIYLPGESSPAFSTDFYAPKPENFTLDLGDIPMVCVNEDYGQY